MSLSITVKINSTDKTSLIDWRSLRIEDNINSRANICTFMIRKHGGQSYSPSIMDDVVIEKGGSKIFAGKIIQINSEVKGKIEYLYIKCKDYTLELDKIIVTERYTNQTVEQIINDIVSNYLSGITTNNVNCSINVETIAFNGIPVSQCLQILAEQTGYSWYIDYDKDIHFFAKNSEKAAFNLSDNSNNFVWDSLKINQDISQLRNVVIIRGGEKKAGNTRTKTHSGDGSETTFDTEYKFAEKPTVKVNGVVKNVGVEFIDDDANYDCLWNYEQKYVRFVTAPASGDSIEIIGYPLIPIIVQVEDIVSIGKYGRFEFKKVDKSIKSTNEAKQYAEAQLSAYANSVREGEFITYTSGLKSGQTININLTNRGINEDFLIQRVSFRARGYNDGEWKVELATLRTIGIIQFLQSLLWADAKKIEVNENEVLEKYYMDNQTVQVTEEISLKDKKQVDETVQVTEDIQKDPFGAGVAPDFVWASYTPTSQTDPKRELVWDRGYWE